MAKSAQTSRNQGAGHAFVGGRGKSRKKRRGGRS